MRVLALLLAPSLLAQSAGQEAPPTWATFTREEMAVVAEINRLRQHPKLYAAWMRTELRPQMEGTLWRRPGRVPVRTQEGLAALDEAIAFLEKVPPCGPLVVSESLARAAQELVREQGPTGQTGHRGPQGSTLETRMARHGSYAGVAGEVITYGPEPPRHAVIQLVIDDGVPGRGHRKALFNPAFKVAGPAIGSHASYLGMTVVVLADGFTPRPTP